MEDYIKAEFLKSEYPLSAVDFKKFNVLLDEEKNIEAFRVTTEGIYMEYNNYCYSKQQIEEFLTNNGFIIMTDQNLGYIKRQIQTLANSNLKYYGTGKPDCC